MEKTVTLILFLIAGLSLLGQQNTVEGETPDPNLPQVFFSLEGGQYDEPLELRLESSNPEAVIFYSLDGNKPGRRSKVYTRPIRLEKTTIVRAVAREGKLQGSVYSQTYFIDEPTSSLPTVSIGIPPWVLFDPKKGLFMLGSNVVDTLWKKPGANFWSRKEVVASVEIYESDGRNVYNNLSGFRLFGGMSRLFPQKSMAIIARKRYGQKRFNHPIFGEDGPKDTKFLVLRNSGSDFGKSHFRDGLMTGLVDDWDMDKQAFRTAQVYINGKYWGIYNIREKVNRYFIEDHHKVDKDSLDLLEHRGIRKRGSKVAYRRFLRWLEKHDLSDPVNYREVQNLMEVDNFMNYQIAQIYFDNQDAGGNIKYWRPRTSDGRWRWILYDTDWGFGLHKSNAYKNNSLAFHTRPDGPRWPNPPWSTFILRKLLESPEFEKAFINRYADHLNTTFHPYTVEDKIDEMYEYLLPEMPRHLKRWNLSKRRWEDQVDRMRTFGRDRANYARMHLMERFHTGRVRQLEVAANAGGRVIINDNIEVRTKLFSGKYFEHIPVSVKAIPDNGYRFVRWEGIDVEDGVRDLLLQIDQRTLGLQAVFEPYTHPLVNKVIINEVSPNHKKAGDWVEIYNHTNKRVSLSGWLFTDTNNEFVLPNVSLDPKDYLVICQDSAKFMQVFPNAYNVIGGLDFGLNKRQEKLGLFSRLGASVDSVYYNIPPTDSIFTLNLLLPGLDNSDFENWERRIGYGSPNSANPYYLESSLRQIQTQWMQMGLAAGVFLICLMLLVLRRRGYL